LRDSGVASASIVPAAGLAALVFAVHPVHAEAVNSIFNRSEMLSSIGVTGGLWWFLSTRQSSEKLAWSGLALVYFGVLLCKESGVTLPALTVLAIWLSSSGSAREKLRQSLPALWLLLPLALFLLLRANALGDQGFAFLQGGVGHDEGVNGGLVFDVTRLPEVVVMWLESLRMLVWPHPLKIFHTLPSTPFWLAAGVQLSLIALSVAAWTRGHVGWLAGLTFFYIALLPASRIIGEPGMAPHVAERYLYLPSVGLSILLALELPSLLKRAGRRPVFIAFLAIVAVFVSLTWSRNQDWSSAVNLAERDYARDVSSGRMVETLAEALLAEGSYGRLVEVCDQRVADLLENWFLSNSCGVAYYQTGRLDDAEQAFIRALAGDNEPSARFNLAGMYLNAGRRSAAREQFEVAIEAEPNGFLREYRQADMLIQLFPTGRLQMLEAKGHLEKSLELQPQFFPARRKLQELNRLLGQNLERGR
jgi:tetratricopeptide (TPR) repeat protein